MLYIIQHFITDENQLLNLQAAITSGDVILLIEDGVYLATTATAQRFTGRMQALIEDVQARGITAHIPSAILLIDYAQFVALTENHTPICQW
jgi:tRNA 2-thiouridine synthesizing protein B